MFLRLVSKTIIACTGILLLFTSFRGLAFPDEGYIVNTGQRILNGQVLYRDFEFVYTPLTAFVTSLSFSILGTSIFSERVFSVVFGLITFFVLLRLGKQLTHHSILYLLPATTYIAWGPTHINFIWPGMWAIDFAIIAFCLLYEAVATNKPKLYYISGICLSLVILTKQNYAVAALLTLLFLIAALKPLRNRLMLTHLSLGITIPISLFLIYTAVTDSTWAFLTNSYVNVIQEVLIKGSINTPLFVGSTPGVALGKFLFYAYPLLLSLLAGFVVWKKERDKLILVGFVAIFYLFGFRPVTDYVHLTPLLSLTGLPLLILITHTKTQSTFLYLILNTLYLILLTVGFWSSLFFGYYRWSPPLISQNMYVDNPRVGIWTDQQTHTQIQTVTNILNKYSKPKEEVFLNYYAPMVYFITDRRNPTRYDYTGLPDEYQRDLVQTLEQKRIRTLITFYLNNNDQSVIGKYINQDFRVETNAQDYEVWQRIPIR